jgi:hypothetical protein
VTDAVPDVVVGDVVRRRIGAGSKSDRDAVVLETGDATLILRRRGGNAFSDPALDALVGQRVRLVGTGTDTTFLIDRFEVIDQPERPERPRPRQ